MGVLAHLDDAWRAPQMVQLQFAGEKVEVLVAAFDQNARTCRYALPELLRVGSLRL